MEVAAFHPSALCRGLVSVALFVTSPCQGVTLHPALRSPDFPLCRRKNRRTAAAWPTPGRDFTACERAGVCFPHAKDRKSTRLNSSHVAISYAVFCLKKKKER